MKIIIVVLFVFASTHAFADKILQCADTIVAKDSVQAERVFIFSFSPNKNLLSYEKISGPDWVFPSGSELPVVSISEDSLRVVAYWISDGYEAENIGHGSVYIFDVNFRNPRLIVGVYGDNSSRGAVSLGFNNPFLSNCMRKN